MKQSIYAAIASTSLLGVAGTAESSGGVLDNFYFGGNIYSVSEWEWQPNSTPEREDEHHLRGEVLLGFEFGDFVIGYGRRFRDTFSSDSSGGEANTLNFESSERFYLFSYGRWTFTHGEFYGAGNFITEDYFSISDATSREQNTYRLDYRGDSFAVAASYAEEVDSSDREERYELGGVVGFGNSYLVGTYQRAVIEGSETTNRYNVLFGHEIADFEFQLMGFHNDAAEANISTEYGATVFYDINDRLTVGGHVSANQDKFETYGLIFWYDLTTQTSSFIRPATLTVQLWDTASTSTFFDNSEQNLEITLNIPFGRELPAAFERATDKTIYKKYGYSDRF